MEVNEWEWGWETIDPEVKIQKWGLGLTAANPRPLWTLIQFFRIQLKKIDNIWRIEWDGISAIKFEATQIHFLSDVFIAVAVVIA